MRILILDTYYPKFLYDFYNRKGHLRSCNYETQHQSLMDEFFGTADSYSYYLKKLGVEAKDIIINNPFSQSAWMKERGRRDPTMVAAQTLLNIPRLYGKFAKQLSFETIVVEQVREFQPDVVYLQDLWFLSVGCLTTLRSLTKAIVGQVASPLPPSKTLRSYDLILSSLPNLVDKISELGVSAQFFPIGFDPRVLNHIGGAEKDINLSFVGGLSRHHKKAVPFLEYLAETTEIQFFGYGCETLSSNSPIRCRHNGEVWGLEMYDVLARSNVTINRHIDISEGHANNMRLFEATGVGTALLTDNKKNIDTYFEPGSEILTYNSYTEACEIARDLQYKKDFVSSIAARGQVKTLSQHSYECRMSELIPTLDKLLSSRKNTDTLEPR